MYQQEKLDQFARGALIGASRFKPSYARHMSLVAECIVEAAAREGFSLETKYVQALQLPLVWFHFEGGLRVPFDAAHAQYLPAKLRQHLFAELRPLRFMLPVEEQRTLMHHDHHLRLEYWLDFSHCDMAQATYIVCSQLEQMTTSPWTFRRHAQVQKMLFSLRDAARVFSELGVMERALSDDDHPLHTTAIQWCYDPDSAQKQAFVCAQLKQNREKILKLWQVAGFRYQEANLGTLPEPERAFTSLAWPLSEPILAPHYPKIAALAGCPDLDYMPANHVVHPGILMTKMAGEQDGLSKLAGLFFKLQDQLLEMVLPEQSTRLFLERDTGNGSINDFERGEVERRLKDRWTSTCWCYLRNFDVIEHLWRKNHKPALASRALEQRLRATDGKVLEEPAHVLDQWLILQSAGAPPCPLESFGSLEDLETADALVAFVAQARAYKRSLVALQPQHMPRLRLHACSSQGSGAVEQALHHYYDTLLTSWERMRRCEALAASAFIRLVGFVDLPQDVTHFCFDALVASTVYRISHGDYSPLTSGVLRKLTESKEEVSLETDQARTTVAARLMWYMPGVPDLLDAVCHLENDPEAIRRRTAFLLQSFGAWARLRGRMRARLGQNLSKSQGRDGVYTFLNIDPYRIERWYDKREQLIQRMDRAISPEALKQAAMALIDFSVAVVRELGEDFSHTQGPSGLISPDMIGKALAFQADEHKRAQPLLQLVQDDLARCYDHYVRLQTAVHLFPRKVPELVEIERLSQQFRLVDTITPGECGVLLNLHQLRKEQWEKLFTRLARPGSDLPHLRPVYSKRLHEHFKSHGEIAPALRLLMICYEEETRTLELAILHQILCVAQPASIRQMPVLADLVDMIDHVSRSGEGLRKEWAAHWPQLSDEMTGMDAGAYRENLQENHRTLDGFMREMCLCKPTSI